MLPARAMTMTMTALALDVFGGRRRRSTFSEFRPNYKYAPYSRVVNSLSAANRRRRSIVAYLFHCFLCVICAAACGLPAVTCFVGRDIRFLQFVRKVINECRLLFIVHIVYIHV